MVSLSNLEFSYPQGDFHLSIPKLGIESSEKVAVIGPSGSGKTTLLSLLAGIVLPHKGSIRVDELEVNSLKDEARRAFRIKNIGFVFQDFELLDYLSVQDNILHPYRISNALVLTREVRERAVTLACEMGIEGYLDRQPGNLSQGERQRCAICRALISNPRLILADEATGNLDPSNKGKILDLLFRAVEERDASLLAVTHDHELLPRFDRVIDFSQLLSEDGR